VAPSVRTETPPHRPELAPDGARRLPWAEFDPLARPHRSAPIERHDTAVTALRIVLQVLLVATSMLLVLFVLLHKGKGGGLSDMFGGGISSSAGSSGVAERNLNRITVGVSLLWTVTIVLLALIARVS
jgi:preprotein translocase subunit SecG